MAGVAPVEFGAAAAATPWTWGPFLGVAGGGITLGLAGGWTGAAATYLVFGGRGSANWLVQRMVTKAFLAAPRGLTLVSLLV